MMASFQLTLSEDFPPYDCQAEKSGILSKYIPHLGAWSIAGFQSAPSYFWVVYAWWDIFLEEDSLLFAFKLSQPPRDATIFKGRNGASIDFPVNSEYFSCDLSYGEKLWKTSLTVSVWSKGTLFRAVKGGMGHQLIFRWTQSISAVTYHTGESFGKHLSQYQYRVRGPCSGLWRAASVVSNYYRGQPISRCRRTSLNI